MAITIEPSGKHIRVTLGGAKVADTHAALALHEGSAPAVYYVPMKDVDPATLSRTETRTHCPYKGDASYWTVAAGGKTAKDAVWGYEQPKAEVAAIAGHVAFYPNRVEIAVD